MKKRTKKLLSVILAGAMAVSMMACGSKGGEEKKEGGGELSLTAEEAKTLEDWGAAVKKNFDGTEITVWIMINFVIRRN